MKIFLSLLFVAVLTLAFMPVEDTCTCGKFCTEINAGIDITSAIWDSDSGTISIEYTYIVTPCNEGKAYVYTLSLWTFHPLTNEPVIILDIGEIVSSPAGTSGGDCGILTGDLGVEWPSSSMVYGHIEATCLYCKGEDEDFDSEYIRE